MAEIQLSNISKIYNGEHKEKKGNTGRKRAVDHISFTVRDKEFMVLVGPSGCGKSTLLRMIAGLEQITEGDLLIDGERMNDLSPRDRNIAMVFQNYALYPHMTVAQNISFGLRLKGINKKEIKRRVEETAELLEIKDFLSRKPKNLSGGQRQRVAIGRAIVRRPKVFLFDEPLSNLDAKLRSQMRVELQKLHRTLNTTIIYVTHDQTEAMTLGDRIAVLNEGKLMQIDSPLRLYRFPKNKFAAGFIGSPRMNFIRGKLREDNGFFLEISTNNYIELPPVPQTLKKRENQDIEIGIRPENTLLEKFNPGTSFTCSAVVTAKENMGNEQLVYLNLMDSVIISRRNSEEEIKIGQRYSVRSDEGKVTFFDPTTGQACFKI